ncbi:MAG: hypothetical protein ABH846_04945 [Patescibacteria group bacterium]
MSSDGQGWLCRLWDALVGPYALLLAALVIFSLLTVVVGTPILIGLLAFLVYQIVAMSTWSELGYLALSIGVSLLVVIGVVAVTRLIAGPKNFKVLCEAAHESQMRHPMLD